MSQKTYGMDLPHILRDYRVLRLSQKNGCGTHRGAAAYLFLGGNVMKNKKIILAAVAVVAVIAIMLGVWFATRPETSEGAKTITVTVVHKDGTSKDFTYHTDEEFLGPVLLSEGLVEGEEGPYGLAISAVDGEGAVWETDKAYWALFVGEDYATTGADSTPIADGDTFKLVYTLG